jgi:hypothetical protein
MPGDGNQTRYQSNWRNSTGSLAALCAFHNAITECEAYRCVFPGSCPLNHHPQLIQAFIEGDGWSL